MKENKETQKNTVLIIDDEELNLKMLTGILSDTYDVKTASSGSRALEAAHDDPPDLILLDVLMPGMDGYEVLTALKGDEKTRKIPVIFITGLDSKEDEERGLAMDAADYISKPLSVGIVRLRVKNQIQIVNQIRTIESLSLIDQLTGIPNRRSLDNRFIMEWARARREGQSIGLMMMDIDKFKVFNDTYGHLIGDDVLKLVAGSFEHSLKRKSDFAARFGGEEFSVLLPNTNIEGTVDIAERIRKEIEQLVIPCGGGKTTTVTVSIGVHCFIPSDDESIPGMIEKADQALYTAKETGRNRVCVYSEKICAGKKKAAQEEEKEEPVTEIESEEPKEPSRESQSGTVTGSLPAAEIISKIGRIDGINTELGMSRFSGMENLYIETVEVFLERLPIVAGEMESALDNGDIKSFSISVHSMKSMLSTVGASGLSRRAEKLENAGKEGDMEYCKTNYPPLHQKLTALQAQLCDAFSAGDAGSGSPQPLPGSAVRRKIIHVDDVSFTLESLRDRLKKYYEIYPAKSHKILFEILEHITPDVILLDVRMPEMDGYEIISALKANPEYTAIPVIFLTSMGDDESVAKCMELGAADVVVKPVPDEELVRRIENQLSS